MCGIAGFYSWDHRRPTPDILRMLWGLQETRGRDAAGAAYLSTDGTIRVLKRKGPVQDLLRDLAPGKMEEIAASPRALFHARQSTKGKEDINDNNHPVVWNGWVVTHNGHVSNDDELFDFYKEARFAEVDTAAIPLVLSKGTNYLDSLRYVGVLGGSVSAAAWGTDSVDRMALWRIGHHSVYLYYFDGIVYWSSSEIAGRLFHTTKIGTIPMGLSGRLEADRLFILEPPITLGVPNIRTFELTPAPYVRTRIVTTAVVPLVQRFDYAGRGPHRPVIGSALGILDYKVEVTLFKTTEGHTSPGPTLYLPKVKGFTLRACELDQLCRLAFASNTDYMTVETMLGSWFFQRKLVADLQGTLVPQLSRTFKPFKGTRKFWKRQKLEVLLPATLHEGRGPLDDRAKTHSITVREPLNKDKGVWISTGQVCPWCGAWFEARYWTQRANRCALCLVRSEGK